MRIAFVSTMHSGSWGGSEELWSQAAVRLKGEGHDVFASVISWIRDLSPVMVLAEKGIQVETHWQELGWTRRIWQKYRYGAPKYYHRLKQFNPDLVIISQGHNGGGFGWARMAREMSRPYVLIAQCNSEHWWFGEQLPEALQSYTAASKIYCVSQRNLELLRLQLGDCLPNAEVIWNPFSIPDGPVPEWPSENSVCRMACPARLYPLAKGQDILLQVLALPQWRERRVELNFFGAGPDELSLQRMVKMLFLDNVNFCGVVSDIRDIWTKNHILVMPSRLEGLPISLVDAMWCKRPAVVTDVGDNGILCVDGESGFVADAPTVASFARALERAWTSRSGWQHMGESARLRVETLMPRDAIGLFCEKVLRLSADGTATRYKQRVGHE